MSKTSNLSRNYREEANSSFLKVDFFGALIFYNKALAYAVTKDDLSLAYANRSAVFFELKKYDECLQNIQWARENQCPQDKLEKLKIREENCKKLKEENKTEVPESFFKLSYPPNPKIPFIVENLTMKTTKQFGRGIYATTNLKPGDVISIEKPYMFFLMQLDDASYKHCCNCLSSCQMNLIPCTKTAAVMYCSVECRNKVYETYVDPQNLVISIFSDLTLVYLEKFIGIMKDLFDSDKESVGTIALFNKNNFKQTIFDFDFSDPNNKDYIMNLMKCIFSLNPKECSREKIDFGLKNYTDHLEDVFTRNTQRLRCRVKDSIFQHEQHALTTLPFASLINHSCDPNVYQVFVDNKVVYIVIKPIKAGEQLFENYNYGGEIWNIPDPSERQERLKYIFDIDCRCDACVNSYDIINFVKTDEAVRKAAARRPMPKTYEEALEELNEYLKYMNEHSANFQTSTNYMLMSKSSFLMCFLAELETFPGSQYPKTEYEFLIDSINRMN